MGEVNLAESVQATQIKGDGVANKNQGTLKTSNGEHTVDVFSNTEVLSEDVSQYLSELQEPVESSELPQMTPIDSQIHEEIGAEIEALLEEFAMQQEEPAPSSLKGEKTEQRAAHLHTPGEKAVQKKQANSTPLSNPQSKGGNSSNKVIYPNLFALARSSLSKAAKEAETPSSKGKTISKPNQAEPRKTLGLNIPSFASEKQQEALSFNSRYNPHEEDQDQDQDGSKQQEEGSSQHQNQEKDDQQQKQKGKPKKVEKIASAKTPARSGEPQESNAHKTLDGIGNIYIRFMALMARILGQAEAEAHQLYLRIKERTDSIDTLTLLVSKINSTDGKIDWSENEEMKQLVDKARSLGVDIPEGKYEWSEDEKRLLKENVQMRKDSMEKVTQLERTDMQRYLQEASQCHQARSNVLKLLKEVMDTIIHNMRP